VVIWNYQYGWPSLTLHFVEREASSDLGTLAHNALQVLLGQFAGYQPLIFPALIAALFLALRRSGKDDRYRFLAFASWPVLLFLFVSMVRVRDAESHWTMVGFMPLAVAAGGWLDEVLDRAPSLLKWYLRLTVAISAVATVGAYIYSQTPALRRYIPGDAYEANKDVFNEMVGWEQIGAAVEESAALLGSETVVASDQYALCAHIMTQLNDQPRVYCPTARRTEFDFLERRDPPPRVPVIYVTNDHYDDEPAQRLPERDCHPMQTVSVVRGGAVLQNYHLYACPPVGSREPLVQRALPSSLDGE
jgi:hypothetical protein